MNFTFLGKYSEYFLKGTEITIVLAFFAVLFGTILGLVLTLLRRSKFKPISHYSNSLCRICKRYSTSSSNIYNLYWIS